MINDPQAVLTQSRGYPAPFGARLFRMLATVCALTLLIPPPRALASDLTVDSLTALQTIKARTEFVVIRPTTNPPSSGPETGDAILRYSFNTDDGTIVTNDVGNTYPATVNGAEWASDGLFPGSYHFDGSGANISAGNVLDVDVGALSELSVAGWVKLDNQVGEAWVVSKNTLDSTLTGWCIVITDWGRILTCLRSDSSEMVWTYHDTTVNDGEWHHVCGQFTSTSEDATTLLYWDGQLVASNGYTGPFTTPTTSTTPLTLGARDESGNCPFSGWMDDFRVYERVLSSVEVLALYTNRPAASTNTLIRASGQSVHLSGATTIERLVPQGDISMGDYTNGP